MGDGPDVQAETPTTVAAFIARSAQYAADSLRYWEPRRVVYNMALFAVVLGHMIAGRPGSPSRLTTNLLLVFFFMAVLANVCYCAAYIVDLFVQFSGLREFRTKGRTLVFVVGTAFAMVIAHFFVMGVLGTTGI